MHLLGQGSQSHNNAMCINAIWKCFMVGQRTTEWLSAEHNKSSHVASTTISKNSTNNSRAGEREMKREMKKLKRKCE